MHKCSLTGYKEEKKKKEVNVETMLDDLWWSLLHILYLIIKPSIDDICKKSTDPL